MERDTTAILSDGLEGECTFSSNQTCINVCSRERKKERTSQKRHCSRKNTTEDPERYFAERFNECVLARERT
ncbi:hypothetical protein AVEN_214990-1, partial [Araneus ventricosus]